MAVLPPSSDLAVIVAVPDFIAVTMPSFTVAIEELLDDHIIFWFSAFDGEIVAVRVWLSPSSNVIEVESNVTDVTVIGVGSFSHDSSPIDIAIE